ncbi:MAG: hypothetical protein OHK93_003643 [Ramalina farinacea]|uniref:Amino acid transporter transmembrane domain-containing protein n=1 Tax=Ramalina farinacea TaxID=258253 RepID=A0AA43QVF8_9LECA|nr:hypothetical protein [Ramalina farinacea]
MTSPRPKKAFAWEDYERGRSPRQGSSGSFGSHVQFDDVATPPGASDRLAVPRNHDDGDDAEETLKHRRSSLSMRINALTHAGGPNSFENFARSWSRAAGFAEIPQHKPSFIVSESGDESIGSKISGDTATPTEPRSLLRQQLESAGTSPEVAVDDETSSPKPNVGMHQANNFAHASPARGNSPFERAPHLSTSLVPSSYGSPYGSIYTSFPTKPSVSSLRREAPVQAKDPSDLEHEPLLFKVVEQEDGTKLPVIIGRSTEPQTIFNSVNVLIGVGLLSLPLGLKQSGWLIGMVFLFCAALATRYTAGLLAKCMELDPTLVSFSDIAWKAFGTRIRIAVGVLFSIELMGACVALVVLFADSLDALIPGWGVVKWKVFCGIILIPLGFVPLRYLSFTSVLGIISCLGIVTLIFVDGFIKPHFPGSLRDPSMESLSPKRWSDLPLSFGLLMSPWGGHSVFPNIYRDMRHPQKYGTK